MDVTLREVNADNVRAVCELQVADDQRKLVAPAAYTIAESAYETGGLLRAIYLGDQPVGVLWVDGVNKDVPYIVRLLVDAGHQRQGIGREAVELVVSHVRDRGASAVSVSYVDAPNGAEGFWRACGFEPTGEIRHREQIARRSLGSKLT
jgi:diamine N-acetyltransferase